LRSFNASLGTIPDYAGPKSGKGVLLAGVRTGGAAEQGGLTRGDVLISLGPHSIDNVEALMYALNALEPGQRVIAVVLRYGKRLELPVALQETGRGH
jgi:S1-C subfamily serine protease